MNELQRKTFVVSRGFTYTYYLHAGERSKSTLFFAHGFPDSAHLWQDLVPHLLKLPYDLLIPDLLGYAGTSKPTDPALYNSRDMSKDIYDILANEDISNIIAIGHDWGSFLVQRLYLFRHLAPKALTFGGLALLNVPYSPPSLAHPQDLKKVNAFFAETFGHPLGAYQEFFVLAPDAASIMDKNTESFYTLIHNAREKAMLELLCTYGATKQYLQEGRKEPIHSYANAPRWKDQWLAAFKEGGFEGPLCWYKAFTPHHHNAEKELMDEKAKQVLDLPVFFLECQKDVLCMIGGMHAAEKEGYLKDWASKSTESGHWCPMEKPDDIAEALVGWLKEKNL